MTRKDQNTSGMFVGHWSRGMSFSPRTSPFQSCVR